MTTVLVFGNSHIGSLKHGLDACMTMKSSIKIDYVGLPASFFNRFQLKRQKLHVPSEHTQLLSCIYDGSTPIDLSIYDYIVFVNGPCRLSGNLYLVNRRIPRYSEDLIRKIVIHGLTHKLFVSLKKEIESSRLIYLGTPLVSTASTLPRHLPSKPLIETDEDLSELHRLTRIVRKCCNETETLKDVPSFLLPPSDLLDSTQMNTLDMFIRGGSRIDGSERSRASNDYKRDMSHGNSIYGSRMAEILTSFFNS
jgi:hypothetical protein